MTKSGRICNISRMAFEAKEILREMELEENRQKLAADLELARQDPLAPYNKKRYPRYVVWELTLACNMRCEHCGSAAGKARPDELTRDEMLRVCDELGELECERVTLLGGEPLVHPHWRDVARRIRDNGYLANVITNGWTLHRQSVCDQLAEAQLSIVGISIDGLGEAHDRIRARPGSFERILLGIDNLKQRQVPVAVATVITNDSMDDLERLYQVLLEKRVRVWQLQVGNPLGRLDPDDPVIISPARLPELLSFIMEKKAGDDDIRIDIADNVGYYGAWEDRGIRQHRQGKFQYWEGCHAGIQAMGLDSNGDVKGCQSLPSTPEFIEGNVRQRPLAEIWNAPDAFRYTRGFCMEDLSGPCAVCSYGPLCKAGCTSAALSHSGHIGDNPMCILRAAGDGEGGGEEPP